MPLVKNSTAMSGLPFAALKQWRTSASGKPIPVKLSTTAIGNSGPESAAAGAGAEAAASVGGDEVSDSDAFVSSFGVDFAAESEAGAAAGGFAASAGGAAAAAATGAGAVAAGAFAAVFFAFVTITTKKSFGFIP